MRSIARRCRIGFSLTTFVFAVIVLVLVQPQELRAQQQFVPTEFGFGAALGLTYVGNGRNSITEAQVVNGVVQPKEKAQVGGSLLVEAHCFDCQFIVRDDPKDRWRSSSPFVVLGLGGDNKIINGLGWGWMWGNRSPDSLYRAKLLDETKKKEATEADKNALKEADAAPSKRTSFNIGIGVYHQFGVRQLADGIEVGKPLPAGQTDIVYKNVTRTSALLLFSFSWE